MCCKSFLADTAQGLTAMLEAATIYYPRNPFQSPLLHLNLQMKSTLGKRVSSETFDRGLKSFVVGCYECHSHILIKGRWLASVRKKLLWWLEGIHFPAISHGYSGVLSILCIWPATKTAYGWWRSSFICIRPEGADPDWSIPNWNMGKSEAPVCIVRVRPHLLS